MYQARSRGRFQPRINSHISYTKTNILIIKPHSTSNSNNNYAKFTKKYLNHYFLRKIYLGLLSLFLSSRCSIVASNYRPYHVYCRFGNLSTNRLWYAFSGDVESRDKYRHLGMFKNYFFSAVEIDRKNGNGSWLKFSKAANLNKSNCHAVTDCWAYALSSSLSDS